MDLIYIAKVRRKTTNLYHTVNLKYAQFYDRIEFFFLLTVLSKERRRRKKRKDF